jgi:hypothetical protein
MDFEMSIYPSYGIDDIGACVDYLVDEGWWSGGKVIDAEEFEVKLSRDKLVAYIEEGGHEEALKDVVQFCWDDIQDRSALKRKSRY